MVRWYRDDCPEWLACVLLVLGVLQVALAGVWIILACYLLRYLFGWDMGIHDA